MAEQIEKLESKKASYIVTKHCNIDKKELWVSILNPMRLYIGKWQLSPSNKNKLVVKGLFVKKQLCYEISSNGCRVKIEIEWSNIIGIRAALKENEPGVLEVELSQPPKFYKELGRKDVGAHNQWVDGSDFTEGQASICRRHFILFPPRILDKHFERLIRFDERLFMLSQRPYPTFNAPYFHSQNFFQAALQNHNRMASTTQHIQPHNQTIQLADAAPSPILPSPVTGNSIISSSRVPNADSNPNGYSNGCTSFSNGSIMYPNGISDEPTNYPNRLLNSQETSKSYFSNLKVNH